MATGEASEWIWDIDLDALVGCNAHLETKDGITREGRISSVNMVEINLGGEKVSFPESVELNGDPGDVIEFYRLTRVDIVSG